MASVPAEPNTSAPVAPMVSKTVKSVKIRADKRRWMTAPQLEWLLTQFPSYLDAQSQGHYDKFWPTFFRDWFEKFPPCEPTNEDPSKSEGENNDSDSDDANNDTNNAKEGNNNTGASKQKQRTNKMDKKRKRFVVLFSLYISIAKFQLNLSPRNYLKLSHRIRENKV